MDLVLHKKGRNSIVIGMIAGTIAPEILQITTFMIEGKARVVKCEDVV